jgi:hypothetical protein
VLLLQHHHCLLVPLPLLAQLLALALLLLLLLLALPPTWGRGFYAPLFLKALWLQLNALCLAHLLSLRRMAPPAAHPPAHVLCHHLCQADSCCCHGFCSVLRLGRHHCLLLPLPLLAMLPPALHCGFYEPLFLPAPWLQPEALCLPHLLSHCCCCSVLLLACHHCLLLLLVLPHLLHAKH